MDAGAVHVSAHHAQHRSDRAGRIPVKAEADGSEEHCFRISGARPQQIRIVGDQRLDAAADPVEAAHLAVVHEQEPAGGEGMAVGAGGGAAGGGAYMGKEQPGANLLADRAQVLVRPGGPQVAKQAGKVTLAVPAKAKAIAIDLGLAFGRVQRLGNQAVTGRGDHLVEIDRRALIGEKATHRPSGPQWWSPAASAEARSIGALPYRRRRRLTLP